MAYLHVNPQFHQCIVFICGKSTKAFAQLSCIFLYWYASISPLIFRTINKALNYFE